MANVKTEVKDGKMIITVDVSEKTIKAAGLSGTGKNKMVATTNGFMPVAEIDGMKISLNVIAPK